MSYPYLVVLFFFFFDIYLSSASFIPMDCLFVLFLTEYFVNCTLQGIYVFTSFIVAAVVDLNIADTVLEEMSRIFSELK